MSNLTNLNKAIDLAIKLQSYRIQEEQLLEKFSKIDANNLNKIENLYSDSTIDTPINFLRRKIIVHLLEKKIITAEWLTDQKEIIEEKTKRKSFKAYSNFSIFFTLIKEIEFEIDINMFWSRISSLVLDGLKLSEKNVKKHWVDFSGERSYGSDRTWMALYNFSHPNQTTAKQFFFLIDSTGLTISFYDRFEDNHIDSRKIKLEENYIEECINFFKKYIDDLIFDVDRLSRKRLLGVKGCNVFKLSHGIDFFDSETIQYCISNNLAVVHQDTKAKGRTDFSQFELFTSAKIGDIFYLTHGNNGILLIGQFIDENISDFDFFLDKKGWKQRKYKLLYFSSDVNSYTGPKTWWSPNDPSTFVQINEKDFNEANKRIFNPHFQVELDSTLKVKLPSIRRGIAANQDLNLIDKNVDPKLNVNLIALQFARLINSLKNEKGQFLGVFGRWGRGKTYFAERVFELINDSRNISQKKYKTIEFNAWKYQDSNAIWAYIYDTLLNEYLNLSNGNKIRKLILIWKLNIVRKEHKELWTLFLSLGINLIWFFLPITIKLRIVFFLVSNLGVYLFKSVLMYDKYSSRIKNLIKEYSNVKDYKSYLGLQAEIQDEIKHLLKTWFKLKTHPKKNGWRLRFFWKRDYDRIIFFVDDLDRCDESKIIEVIDSLRVLLEDKEIIEKVIILAAIDESILKTAIEWKYRDLLDFKDNEKGEENSKHRTLEITTREYIDKLFIGGIKLPALNNQEQYSILKNYAESSNILEKEPLNPQNEIDLVNLTKLEIELFKDDKYEFPTSIYEDVVLSQDEYFLLQSELTFLNTALVKYKNAEMTPRQLRIYLNRYLFAKNLALNFAQVEIGINDLKEEYYIFLAEQIANRTFNLNCKINYEFLDDLNLQDKMKEFTIAIIDMVVSY